MDRQLLPRKILAFFHLQFPRPLVHLAEMQFNQGVRVVDALGFPRLRTRNGDAQFLLQFAGQGLRHGFTRFDFAARKFPMACISFAGRAGGQQETPIGLEQHAHGHQGDGAISAAFARQLAIGHTGTGLALQT